VVVNVCQELLERVALVAVVTEARLPMVLRVQLIPAAVVAVQVVTAHSALAVPVVLAW
jgi:hypothetical protein